MKRNFNILLLASLSSIAIISCANTNTYESDKEVQSESFSETNSVEYSDTSSETISESNSEEESSISQGPLLPEVTKFSNFTFNSANENMSVWTNIAINGKIAPMAANVSETEEAASMRTYDVFAEYGYYTFVIDCNGFLEFASYGAGAGWGAPTGGTYHNYNVWDGTQLEFYILHEEWAKWPARTLDGRNAWVLYDFVIPEGGFLITGWYDNSDFNEFWKYLFGCDLPVLTNITVDAPNNNDFLKNLTPKSLDHLYFSIGEDKQLEVRERLESETKENDNYLDNPTPAIRYEPTAADAVVE